MRKVYSVPYSLLYTAWGVLFILTVVLGFAYPEAAGMEKGVLVTISVLFFLPPAMVLLKSRRDGSHHRIVLRNLSLGSLLGTLVLLVLNLCSVGWPSAVGTGLHAALTVVSSPMVCSNFFVLPLFLWACLLMGSLAKKK